jgi:arsenate reductase
MAEAFLRNYAGDRFEAYSAGLEPKEINPLTKQVMAEVGIDISAQSSKSLKNYLGKVHFGFLITVCSQAEKNCPSTFPGVSQRLYWNMEDPAGFSGTPQETLEKFRNVRDQIKATIKDWVDSRSRG